MAGRRLRPAEELLAPAVADTIAALKLAPEDAAAVSLARRYAATIDAAEPHQRAEAIAVLGPKLLTVLESLGATPVGRSRLKGGAPTRAESRLAALREARRN